MSDDLVTMATSKETLHVRGLRVIAAYTDVPLSASSRQLIRRSADRIEALEAENKAMREALTNCPMCERKDQQLAAVDMLVGDGFAQSVHEALDRLGAPRTDGPIRHGIIGRIEALLPLDKEKVPCPRCGSTAACVSAQGNRLPRPHATLTKDPER
jgi:hypothetical protein